MKFLFTCWAICSSCAVFSQAQLIATTHLVETPDGTVYTDDSISFVYDSPMQSVLYWNHFKFNHETSFEMNFAQRPTYSHKTTGDWEVYSVEKEPVLYTEARHFRRLDSSTEPYSWSRNAFNSAGDIAVRVRVNFNGDTIMTELFSYNAFGDLRIVDQESAFGQTSKYTIENDASGKAKKVFYEEDDNGFETEREYHRVDSAGLVSRISYFGTFGLMNEAQFSYDSNGRLIQYKTVVPSSNSDYQWIGRHNYNALNQVDTVRITVRENNQLRDYLYRFEYDANGNVSLWESWDDTNLVVHTEVDYLNEHFLSSVKTENLNYLGQVLSTETWRYYYSENLGLEEETLSDFLVVPNPNNGIFKINSSQDIDAVKIYDSNGRLLEEKKGLKLEENIHLNLAPGVYLVQVLKEGAFATQRLVIE